MELNILCEINLIFGVHYKKGVRTLFDRDCMDIVFCQGEQC